MKFYIVATPIGNLDDITFRAIETLKNVDLILCEDTRQTQKILNHFEIKTKTLSYHQHSDDKKVDKIIELISNGQTLALVSDAGTPGIADPGQMLIQEIVAQIDSIEIIAIPGASAIISTLSVSGFDTNSFQFLGFCPKKGQQKFWDKIIEANMTSVFYESTHRILKTLEKLAELIPERKVLIARELTKKFETLYRGKLVEVLEKLRKSSQKGEFTIVINKK
jgi:16S rRNA (cytidine1402-2'-O)-methyltransferase